MITPQNVIQSIDQKPVPAPSPHAANVSLAGVPHTVAARMIVTTAPIVTACHADIRMTGSKTSSSTIGISAMSVLPSVECAGLSDWVKPAAAPSVPALAVARNILHHLPVIAYEVTITSSADWRKACAGTASA